ncbi:hypothetical protein HG535_0B05210 [Zygotorulaspora mrakii]|uniref:Guanine nucleotide-binding protein subunit gamma n=1 Tax=Zygotorulaspora mrakii TaxID=42260 RepID=A0A7H9B0I1_ZYGMR|nr:uncharacterized protein HG535_0B05210 [Zygotorulaspora mrakii]QLG71479.1 hypothetical protein HG535_0B05210 [Zygotorulaspora mrakii]
MSQNAAANGELRLKIKYLKLKRVNELNSKLRNELSRERITASNACLTLVNYVSTHRDYTLPELWGYPQPGSNRFANGLQQRNGQNLASSSDSMGCCTLM